MERVDLYNENRIPLGKTAERYARRKSGEYRTVVHICIFDRNGRMLIQQRSQEKRMCPGKWDVSAAGAVDAGETVRQSAEREVWEELGYVLDLSGVRPSVTVNYHGGFDDYFLVVRELDLETLVLQKEEVTAVRWASQEEVLCMIREDLFIGYPESFIQFLFDMREQFGFVMK